MLTAELERCEDSISPFGGGDLVWAPAGYHDDCVTATRPLGSVLPIFYLSNESECQGVCSYVITVAAPGRMRGQTAAFD